MKAISSKKSKRVNKFTCDVCDEEAVYLYEKNGRAFTLCSVCAKKNDEAHTLNNG